MPWTNTTYYCIKVGRKPFFLADVLLSRSLKTSNSSGKKGVQHALPLCKLHSTSTDVDILQS